MSRTLSYDTETLIEMKAGQIETCCCHWVTTRYKLKCHKVNTKYKPCIHLSINYWSHLTMTCIIINYWSHLTMKCIIINYLSMIVHYYHNKTTVYYKLLTCTEHINLKFINYFCIKLRVIYEMMMMILVLHTLLQ